MAARQSLSGLEDYIRSPPCGIVKNQPFQMIRRANDSQNHDFFKHLSRKYIRQQEARSSMPCGWRCTPNVDSDNELVRKKLAWSIYDDLVRREAEYQKMTPEEKTKASKSCSMNSRVETAVSPANMNCLYQGRFRESAPGRLWIF